MYGKKTGVKKSLRPKARPKGLGSTRHPTGLNINEQNTIVFKRDKPRGK